MRAMSTTGFSARGYANAYAIPCTADFQQVLDSIVYGELA